MVRKANASSNPRAKNPGNLQQGRQQGQNTGQEAWKSNIQPRVRYEAEFPKTRAMGTPKKKSHAGRKRKK